MDPIRMSTGNAATYNTLRNVIVGCLGEIPEVGFLVAIAVDAFWPEAEPSPSPEEKLYDAMKQLAKDIDHSQWVTHLKTQITYLKNDARAAAKDVTKTDFMLSRCNEMENDFMDPSTVEGGLDDQPQNTIGLAVMYGTLYLSALRDRCFRWSDIYGSKADPGDRESFLNEKITSFTRRILSERDRVVAWRQGRVTMEDASGLVSSGWAMDHPISTYSSWYKVVDAEGQYGGQFDNLEKARQCFRNAQWDIKYGIGGYVDKLNGMIDAWRFWRYMNTAPGGPSNASPGWVYAAERIGSGMRTGSYFNHRDLYAQYGDITRLDIWFDDGALKGIQVQYGSGPLLSSGKITGSHGYASFGSDDLINCIYWRAGDLVDKFAFNLASRINKQSAIGPADNSNRYWPASSPVNNSNVRLAYIGGVTDNDVISQLQIVWKVWDNSTQDLPMERSQYVIQGPSGTPM